MKKILLAFLFFMCEFSFAETFWGALYIDVNTGIAGGVFNADSENHAKKEALASCQEKHQGRKNNCSLATVFYNGCISAYWAPNKKYGWGFSGYGTRDATIDALESCQEKGGKGCKEVLTFCTTRYY